MTDTKVKMSEENDNEGRDEEVVKEIVDTFVGALKIPKVVGAYLREDEHFLNVISEWSVSDVAKKERVTFSRMFAVLKTSLKEGALPVVSEPGSAIVDEIMSVAAKSGRKRAVLVDKPGKGEAKTEFLQIWDENSLLKTYNLEELDVHKAVYTSANWGVTMAWSPDESKLAYIAEKKVPKAKSFYTSATASKKEEEGKSSKEIQSEKAGIGEEYTFRQTWGEQVVGAYNSVIVVVNLSTDEFKVLPLPEAHFPTDIQWANNSHIIGVTYPLPIWRLGLLFCSNKESILFSVQDDGENFQLITKPNKAAMSPRISPNGDYLVWLERIIDGAHKRSMSLHGLPLINGLPALGSEAQLLYSDSPINGLPIYQTFSSDCWSVDSSTLFVATPNQAKMILLAIPIANPSKPQIIEGVNTLLAVTKDYLLVGTSSIDKGPSLNLLSIAEDYRRIPITTPPISDLPPIEKQFIFGEASPPSIYYGQETSSVPPNSVPLIAFPHGGPHSVFVDCFDPEVVLFLKLGYAVLKLNYIGSLGGTRDTTSDLLGKCGNRDVKDCHSQVEKLLKSVPSLNPDKVVLYGCSHGGFLGAHLSSQYPSAYKAAVLQNPVTDMSTMIGTTDITDWVYAEAGIELPKDPIKTIIPTVRDLADAKKLMDASPIQKADNVQCATLLQLGNQDLRVPMQQGICYYRALKAYGKTAEIRMYPDNHPLFKIPVWLDSVVHTALWFNRYLR